ncbi:MAG: GNAT family N-acetyltransferase [Bdellovibrionota bacterium]
MQTTFQSLAESDLTEIAEAFLALGWDKPRLQYETYLREQSAGYRSVIVCRNGAEQRFAGYVTVVWDSLYPGFQNLNIPEIVDLNVLPEQRRQGLGAGLMEKAEMLALARGHRDIGLGVGLLADYGSAQRLYFRLGYSPDGRGLYSGNRPAQYGEMVEAGDDLVLYLAKKIQS